MNNIGEWFEVAKYIGAGGAFVMGIACWKLWGVYLKEVAYSKTRDKETLTVLSTLIERERVFSTSYDINSGKILHALETAKIESITSDNNRELRLMSAINSLRDTILQHRDKVDKN